MSDESYYHREIPRPGSASTAGYLLVGMALFGLLRSFLLANTPRYHETDPSLIIPHLFIPPLLAGIAAWPIFRGGNWGRFLVWLLVLPASVASPILIFQNQLGIEYLTLLYPLAAIPASVFLLMPNAHWYYTGRNYRRRPAYREQMEERRRMESERPRGYEY